MTMTLEEAIDALHAKDYSTRRIARDVLSNRVAAVLPHLLKLIEAGTHPAGTEAIFVLASTCDAQFGPIFINALRSNNPIMGQAAARAIAGINPFPTADVLNTLPEAHDIVKPLIIRSIGQHGSSDATPVLVAYLEQVEDATLQYTLIEAIGLLGNPLVSDVLKPYLHDSNHHVREYAARALVQLQKTRPTHKTTPE